MTAAEVVVVVDAGLAAEVFEGEGLQHRRRARGCVGRLQHRDVPLLAHAAVVCAQQSVFSDSAMAKAALLESRKEAAAYIGRRGFREGIRRRG